MLDRLEGRETCDLVTDVAQPVVSRVIGSFMGIPPEDDEIWARLMNATLGAGDPDLNPEGVETVMQRDVPEIFERCRQLIAERRENPTDDLTSVLVHAEVDGERLEEHEIVMGFFLLVAAGNDSHQGDLLQRRCGRCMEHPEQRQLLLDDPSLVPERGRGGAADVPRVRPLPPHGDARHRAQRQHDQGGRQGRHVVRLVQPRRDALRGPRPLRRRAATPSTRPSAPAAATSASAPRWRGSSCSILFEETLARYPDMELDGEPEYAESPFVNQLKTLPVRLNGSGANQPNGRSRNRRRRIRLSSGCSPSTSTAAPIASGR